jgi:PKD repeat protein
VVDATTGASLTSYGTALTATWDAKDVNAALVSDGIYNVRIEFTWGTTTNTANTTISFNKSGTAVHLTPADVAGVFTGMTLDWLPATAAAPVAAFTANNTSICQNGSVTFTDQSTNTPTSWAWTFAGGTPATSSLQNPTVTFASAGTHTVALTATNAGGNNTSTMSNYITTNAAVVPSVSLTPSATTVCPGTTVVLTAVPTNGGTPTYAWTVNGSPVGTNSNTYSAAFTNGQAVVCTMTSTAACANPTVATSSTFNTAVYTVAPVVITQTTGTLNSNATSGNHWYEQVNGIIASATSATYTPTASGSYYTIVTDVNGCTSTSNVIVFTYTGINENALISPINIYPNPSKGIVNISFENVINGQISIEDYTGREVYNEIINQNAGSVKIIDLTNYSNGIYFVNYNEVKYKLIISK